MRQVFRDRSRAVHREAGVAGLLRVCGAEICDLAINALKEHGDASRAPCRVDERERRLASATHVPVAPPRLWGIRATTIIAYVVSLVSSINLYLLEDASPLTSGAYSASPLLRFSYDGVYLSALVAAISVCAIVAYTLAEPDTPVIRGLTVVTLLVGFGGFGGLLARHPVAVLALFLGFSGLALLSFLCGRAVVARSRDLLGWRSATILGACVGAMVALLVNLLVLVTHTLALDPVSHPLYMQA